MYSAVFCSRSGFTAQYAKMFSDATGIPAFSVDDQIPAGDIIFFGWISGGGKVNGLDRVDRSRVRAVCAVGMCFRSDFFDNKIISMNSLDVPMFYLQGGVDRKSLSIGSRLLFAIVSITTRFRGPADEGRRLREVMKRGGTFVTHEQLAQVIDFATRG